MALLERRRATYRCYSRGQARRTGVTVSTVTYAVEHMPTTVPAAARSPWMRRHYVLISALALLQMVLRAEVPTDSSVLWSARAGEDFLRSRNLPHVDSYSWTAFGHSWIPNSWAWNVVLGGAYREMGNVGFLVVAAGLAVLMALAVAWTAQRIGAPPFVTIAVYAAIGMFGLVAVPRAQTLSTIVPLLVPPLVVRALSNDRRRSTRAIMGLGVLEAAWMNLHSAALIGPVLVFACGAALVIASGRRSRLSPLVRRLAAATAVSGLGCLLTPYVTAPVRHASEVRSSSVGIIGEWSPVGFGDITRTVGLICVLLAPIVAWRVWRSGRPEVAAGIVVLAAASADAIRFLPVLGVFAAAEIALWISRANVRPQWFRLIAGATVAVLVALTLHGLRDIRSLGAAVSPRLVDALPSGCRLLNDDIVGNAVVLYRPDVPVAVDGRNDLYGRDLLLTVIHLFDDRPGTHLTLARDRVTCILGPSDTQLVERLRSSPAWRVVDQDSVRTLLVRQPVSGGRTGRS
jgi:hypothetical protein